MCGSMTDIQSLTAEIRRGKKKKEQMTGWKYIWSALLHRATIKNLKPGLVTSYDLQPGNGAGPVLQLPGPMFKYCISSVILSNLTSNTNLGNWSDFNKYYLHSVYQTLHSLYM